MQIYLILRLMNFTFFFGVWPKFVNFSWGVAQIWHFSLWVADETLLVIKMFITLIPKCKIYATPQRKTGPYEE